MKPRFFTGILLLPLLVLLLNSCNNGSDCPIENVAYARYGFYNASGASVAYSDTLSVYLMVNGHDSIILNHSTATSSLTLPVSYTRRVDTLIFLYSGIYIDSLYLYHTNIPYFVSMDCGTAMYHNIEKVTSTHIFIDSIHVTEPFINYDERENIKIYFGN